MIKLLTFIKPDPTCNKDYLFWYGNEKNFLDHPIEMNISEIIILKYISE